MNTPKRILYLIKLWCLLWTSWAFLLLLPIIVTLAAHKFGLSITPPHIYITLAIIFFNGLVFSPIILGSSISTDTSLAIGLLVGLAQWFFIYKLGRLWLLNWQNLRWYFKPLFPIFLVGYYAITGILSLYLFVMAVT
jgi:hypothetical protein